MIVFPAGARHWFFDANRDASAATVVWARTVAFLPCKTRSYSKVVRIITRES